MTLAIKNVAAENAIRRAVDSIPGCACVSIKAQSDFYLVHISEFGGSRVIRAENAAHAARILNRMEPES